MDKEYGNNGRTLKNNWTKSFFILISVILLAALIATGIAAMSVAGRLMDEMDKERKSAGLYEEAMEALETAKKLAEKSKTDLEAAESLFNDAKEEYIQAKNKLTEAELAYNAAVTISEEAREAYEDAVDSYNGAESRLSAAQAALNEAKCDYQDVIDILSELEGAPVINLEPTANAIYKKTIDAIVEIRAYEIDGTYFSLGSGFLISEDGKIATNYHVIDGAFSLKVLLNDGNLYDAESVLGYDKDIDIAVIKINKTDCGYLELSETLPEVGDTIYAIGSNLGLTRTFAKGVVGYVDREIEDFPAVKYIHYVGITHSGNSGCPILNAEGEVIGIHQLGDVQTGDNGLAIPVENLANLPLDKNETPSETAYNGAVDVSDNLYYSVSGGVATITGIKSVITDYIIYIPSEIDGYPVKKIDWGIRDYYLQYVYHIVIGEGVEELGADVFNGANSLLSVKIPSSIKSIDASAFNYCLYLYKIYLGDNPYYKAYDEVLYNAGKTVLLAYPKCKDNDSEDSYTTSYAVFEGVEAIGDYAFFANALTEITLPSTLKTIGSMSFAYSENLEAITLPEGLLSTGAGAFSNITGLTAVTIPASVTGLGDIYTQEGGRYKGVFYYSSGIQTVTFAPGSNLETLGDGIFEGLSRLTAIILPESVSAISKYVFSGCYNLQTADLSGAAAAETGEYLFNNCSNLKTVSLPAGLMTIKPFTFAYCYSLVTLSLPENLLEIGEAAFYYCNKLNDIELNENLKTIGPAAFYNCLALEEMELPQSVDTLDGYAFAYCENLVSITLAEGIKKIGEYTFYSCIKLESIVIPASVKQIREGAFGLCEELAEITVNGAYCPYIDADLFESCNSLAIYVDSSAYGTYLADSAWRIYLDKINII